MPVNKNKHPERLENSPLFNSENTQSTIHPEKLEFARFSELQKVESNAKTSKIIIYMMVVVVLGVGSALFIRNIVLNSIDNYDANTSSQDITNTKNISSFEETGFILNIVSKSDNNAVNVPNVSDFKDSQEIILGDTSAADNSFEVNTIQYDKYTNFSRLTFKFQERGAKLPPIKIQYNKFDKTLNITFPEAVAFDEKLTKETQVDKLVKKIYQKSQNSYLIELTETISYRPVILDGNFVVDMISTVNLSKLSQDTPNNINNKPSSKTETKTINGTTGSTSQEDPNKPNPPHYKNKFSQNKQFVSSKVLDNNIKHDNYWVWDEGSFFELSFGETNKLGEDYIPNAVAYYDSDNKDKVILVLEVENLAQAVLSNKKKLSANDIQNISGINMSGTNFVAVELVSFVNGKATYNIELKRKSDFQLLTQENYTKTTQIISVQIKD